MAQEAKPIRRQRNGLPTNRLAIWRNTLSARQGFCGNRQVLEDFIATRKELLRDRFRLLKILLCMGVEVLVAASGL